MTYYFLQSYWWFLISLLAGILVFLMFVQGANVQLINSGLSDIKKRMIANSTGRKWELAFTTLVVFGGAFFASFPLFYSTSFGGAYWVWMLLLATFVFQAVSYEFLHKKDNLLGVKGFRIALVLNGFLAPFLIGTAVGTFFTGSDFIINKTAILDVSSPIISSWGNAWRGLDALAQPHAVLLGLALVGLTTILGALYLINNIKDSTIESKMRATIKYTALPFVALFVTWLVILILRDGYAVDSQGVIYMEEYKYLNNLLDSPVTLIMLLAGVILVLIAIWFGAFTKSRKGIWFGGIGTIITVMAVFFTAGYNNTAFYPSFSNMQSSLTITNSSSSEFTLMVMSIVSLLIPFVVMYIYYAWRQMDRHAITEEEISNSEHKY